MTTADTSVGERAQKKSGGFAAAQEALVDEMNTVKQHWADSVQGQFNLTVEWMSRLASARNILDLMTANQDWAVERGSLIADEGKLLLDDYQRVAATAAKCFNHFMPASS